MTNAKERRIGTDNSLTQPFSANRRLKSGRVEWTGEWKKMSSMEWNIKSDKRKFMPRGDAATFRSSSRGGKRRRRKGKCAAIAFARA